MENAIRVKKWFYCFKDARAYRDNCDEVIAMNYGIEYDECGKRVYWVEKWIDQPNHKHWEDWKVQRCYDDGENDGNWDYVYIV